MPRLSADKVFLHADAVVTGSTFGEYTEVGQGARIVNSEFGAYAYCDRFADIANTTVGRFANIAAFTRIGPTDHPMDHASLHHFHYRSSYYWDDIPDDAEFFARRAARRCTLGPDAWVGHGAIIRPEVSVGAGAVVAAGAVVTKDVAPYMIVAGVPAVPLRRRLTEDVADRLIALAWWNWPHKQLRDALPDFRALTADAFLKKYGG
jgi:phosphonate metabolism protein (transferase hexapeptide repeat family)